MVARFNSPENIVLFGLEQDLAIELHSILEALNVPSVRVFTDGSACPEFRGQLPDLIFCASSRECLHQMTALRNASSDVPVIVVSRNPEDHEWIDAMEAGASDYCAPPFERFSMKWLLQTNISRQLPM